LAAVTAMHVPVVLAACPFKVAVHALQPVQSLSQQTPSAMIPDTHSKVWVDVLPFGFFATQMPAVVSQYVPVSHWACVEQVFLQPVVAHS
jgi:hypothetical protein